MGVIDLTMQLRYPLYLSETFLSTMTGQNTVSLDDMYQYYQRFQSEILGYLINKGFDRETAEDLLHDTFFKACKQVSKGGVRSENVRAWLYSIAHNTAISRYRKKKEVYRQDMDIESESSDPTSNTENKILQNDIFRFVDKHFSERERDIFNLRIVQGLTYQDIADILKMSKTTVMRVDENNLNRIKVEFGDLP